VSGRPRDPVQSIHPALDATNAGAERCCGDHQRRRVRTCAAGRTEPPAAQRHERLYHAGRTADEPGRLSDADEAAQVTATRRTDDAATRTRPRRNARPTRPSQRTTSCASECRCVCAAPPDRRGEHHRYIVEHGGQVRPRRCRSTRPTDRRAQAAYDRHAVHRARTRAAPGAAAGRRRKVASATRRCGPVLDQQRRDEEARQHEEQAEPRRQRSHPVGERGTPPPAAPLQPEPIEFGRCSRKRRPGATSRRPTEFCHRGRGVAVVVDLAAGRGRSSPSGCASALSGRGAPACHGAARRSSRRCRARPATTPGRTLVGHADHVRRGPTAA
jgi:hypothetical protein